MDVSLPKLLESHFGPESQPIQVTEAMQAISGQSKASVLQLEQRIASAKMYYLFEISNAMPSVDQSWATSIQVKKTVTKISLSSEIVNSERKN